MFLVQLNLTINGFVLYTCVLNVYYLYVTRDHHDAMNKKTLVNES